MLTHDQHYAHGNGCNSQDIIQGCLEILWKFLTDNQADYSTGKGRTYISSNSDWHILYSFLWSESESPVPYLDCADSCA